MGYWDYRFAQEQEQAEFNARLHNANDLVIERKGQEALEALAGYSYDEILEGADNTGGACMELYRFIKNAKNREAREMSVYAVARELDRSFPKSAKLVRDELNGGL